MDFFVSPEIRAICFENDVWIESGVSVGRLAPRKIGIEGPARLKRGIYDIDLIGAYTYFGADCMFYHVGSIGRFCSIASGIQAGDAEHPAHFLSPHPIFQADPAWTDTAAGFLSRNRAMIDRSREKRQALDTERFGKIQIGNDVWIGEGVFIRRGIEIGDGAVIGARSVVTRDVPPYAIVGGAPAKLIRYRFEPDVIAALLDLQWWLYGLNALENVDFTDVRGALAGIHANISSGRATFYQGPVLNVGQDEVDILDFDRDSGTLVPRG